MKYAIWGDFHSHPWQETDGCLGSNRWVNMHRVITDVYQNAEALGCDYVVFLGDLFENKKMIRTDVAAITLETLLYEINKSELKTVFVAGNHDKYNDSSILDIFDGHVDKASIVLNYEWNIPGTDDWCIPFGIEEVNPELQYRYLFTHQDIRGGLYNRYQSSPISSITEDLFSRHKYDRLAVFNGHHHIPQTIDLGKDFVPIYCVGAPCEHSWKDIDSSLVKSRGMMYLDTEDAASVRWIYLKGYPRFFSLVGSRVSLDFNKLVDFVRTIPEEEEKEQVAVAQSKTTPSNINEEMTKYVQMYYNGHLSVKQLVDLGVQLYQGA